MSTEFFIARRIYKSKDAEQNISPPAIKIAIISIALGLAIMILSVAVAVGFKKEVRNKVIGFGSHIQVSNFDSNASYEAHPIVVSDSLMDEILRMPNILHAQKFATKPGLIKTGEDSHGIIVKGVGEDYDWNFFRRNMVEGEVLSVSPDSVSNNVMISRLIASQLKLKLGDSFIICFVHKEMEARLRKFTVSGIFQTNFGEYDKLFIFADIKQIRKLNGWDDDMIGGLEVLVKNYDKLDDTSLQMYYDLQAQSDRTGNIFYTRSIKQLNPMIFAWLDVLDNNVAVILALILVVAGFSMITGLLIIILERTNMIGILKVLGENNVCIRKIFLYISAFLITKGLLWGNIIAIAICLIQKYFGIFKLNPVTYYVSEVPIDFNILVIVLINIGTLIATLTMLTVPSYLIAKIPPTKTVRYE
ncbi:MAG: ABC transporter permease [Dysgonamonadaceae bacterium]|nr:ABC transporter permease [Dysgonamonadaceae bacterium]